MADEPIRCPLCGSVDVTPCTQIYVYGNREASLAFRLNTGGAIGVNLGKARVCLECGQVLWVLADDELAKLRAHKQALTPV